MKRKLMAILCATLLTLPMLTFIPPVLAQSEEPTLHVYRPKLASDQSFHINETVHNANTTDEASVGIGVNLLYYKEDWDEAPFAPDRDGVTLRVALTANTRKGITYQCSDPHPYVEWIEAVDQVPGVTGDNSGAWLNITLDYGARFYGGPGYEAPSAQYSKVWVCSNGFLSFDSEFTGPPNISGFPDSEEPNSLLAVHWADLLVDDQAEVTYYGNSEVFCVCWKNVLNKNNEKRQTFEVIIENDRLFARGQNVIRFLYKNVTWSGSGALVGIEDQEGYKGTLGSYAPSGNELEFIFKKSAEIKRLKIKIEKPDPNALIRTDTSAYSLRGINVMLENDDPDAELWYENALNDFWTLLISEGLSLLLGSSLGGIVFEVSLIGMEFVAGYAHEFSPLKREEADIHDSDSPNDPEAHIYVKAETVYDWPVDASIGAQVHWVFTDNNTEDHSLRITAELEYTYYDWSGYSHDDVVSTSVNLIMEIGHHTLTVSAGSGGTTNPAPGTHTYLRGESVNVTASAYSHYTFDHWVLDDTTIYDNPINVPMFSNRTLNVYFTWVNTPPNTPSTPWGESSGHVYTNYTYTTNTTDPEGDFVRCEFSWGDGTSDWTFLMLAGPSVRKPHSWTRPGTYSVSVRAEDEFYASSGWSNPLAVSISQNDAGSGGDAGNSFSGATFVDPGSHSGRLYESNPTDTVDWYKFYVEHGQAIQVSMTPPSAVNFNLELYDPSGNFRTGSYLGAGCTDSVYASAESSGYWRAKIYIQSGEGQYSFSVTISTPGGGEGCPILYVYNGSEYACEGLLNIHNTEGIDIVTNHTLLIIPQCVYGTYLFQLVEHPYTHSYIDRVKLYAVLKNGMTIQLPLIWAWHSEYSNVLPQLLFSDDWRTETIGAIHNNGTSQRINLRFLALPPNIEITALIFQIEGYNPEFKP